MCEVWKVVSDVLNVYFFILIAYAAVTWIPSIRGRWSDYLGHAGRTGAGAGTARDPSGGWF